MLPAIALAILTQTPWDPALKAAGADAQAIQISPTKWRGGGLYALKSFNASWDDWRQLEPSTLDMARRFLHAAPDRAILMAANELDLTVKPEPTAKEPKNLEEAILACGTPTDQLPALRLALKSVPKDVAAIATHVLAVMPAAFRLRQEAVAPFAGQESEAINFARSYDLGPHTLDEIDKFDLAKLAGAAAMIAKAVEDVENRHPSKAPFEFSWTTPMGRIELSGGKDDHHDLDGTLLVIDTGGNDTYTATPDRSGFSTVIDYAGNDAYKNCGLALFGVSEIFDLAGDDTYEADNSGDAAAVFGVALIVDQSGKDTYECRDLGEGAAVDGIALLIDRSGNDDYECHSMAQGLGGVKGFGALIDNTGDDRYVADDTKIDNPSPQTAQHNTSLAQGCGFGRRANPGDGHSMAGGVGLLVDGAGNDSYKCGVFGQGVAYWYSRGALVDFGGNDSYDGVWYVQGSAAHYALGVLLDLGGDDTYLARMHQSQGQGHDYSIGILHDFGGSDSFECQGGASLGSGRWNGLGLFLTDGPNTAFKGGGGDSFGIVGDRRPAETCDAVFWARGKTTFTGVRPGVKADSIWVQKDKGLFGIGLAGKVPKPK